jgi:hypothetical protein
MLLVVVAFRLVSPFSALSPSRANFGTASVEQFQCDQGVGPTYGFAIDSNDTLTYSGSSVFYACPASDTEWNLYTTPVVGQLKCVEISLTASGCGATSSATQSVSYITVSACPTVSTVVSTVTVYACGTESTTSELGTSTPPITTSGTQPTTTPLETSKTIVVVPTSSSETVESTATATATATSSVTPTTWPHTYISPTTTASVLSSSKQANSTTWVTIKTASTFSVVTTTAKATSSFYWSNSTSTVAPSSSSTSASSSCATTLSGSNTSGNYQWPHLIVPISSSSPDTAAGTSYFGSISPNTSTIFNFDIPSSYAGHTCSLIFLLPLQSQLETSSYTYSPTGSIDFEQLSSPASTSTTWNNAPSVSSNLGEFSIAEGSSTLVSTFACPAGQTVAYEATAVGDTDLYYFQDWNPSPIGLYITYC